MMKKITGPRFDRVGCPVGRRASKSTSVTREFFAPAKHRILLYLLSLFFLLCSLVYKGKQLESGTEQTLKDAGLFDAAMKKPDKTVGVSVILALR